MQNQIIVNGIKVSVQRKNVKRVTLKVSKDQGAVVVCPINFKFDELVEFVYQKEGWLRKQLSATRVEKDLKFVSGETHYLWGKPYQIKVCLANKDIAFFDGETIVLAMKKPYETEKRSKIMNEFYKKQVLLKATPRFEFWMQKTGLRGQFVGVKNTKRQLGCCNPKTKEISLSLELAKRNSLCLDYVICHELCHTKIPNHSKEFHDLERKIFPFVQEAKLLLKK